MPAAFPSLMFLNIRRYKNPPDYIADFFHKPRPYFSLAFIEKGVYQFREDDRSFDAMPGDIVLTPQDSRYLYRTFGEENQMISVHFGFRRSAAPFAGRRYLVQKLADPASVAHHFPALFEAFGHEKQSLSMMAHLFSLLDGAFDGMCYESRPPMDSRLLRAVEYLDTGFREPVTVGEPSAMCGLSESHFYNLWRTSLGMTPREYRKNPR
ncbi:MAG: AraC family transcriptional regulator [Ruminococcaceae bacterium]|nr:AraC family transcriptional regulator [Oscillospiraceae bacterium]